MAHRDDNGRPIDVVTGVAGFVGSRLAARLLKDGHVVRGVDCLTDYYERERKLDNLAPLREHPRFQFVLADLATARLDQVVTPADRIYHLAGQPGVRGSWGPSFADYVHHNVVATQRLLEACRQSPGALVYASSSSVYGHAIDGPVSEATVPRPISPYGVTKLAAEHLCLAYGAAFDFPVAALRLFTVYGPGQRPDMAFSRLIGAALGGEPFHRNGDGWQRRDFTFVDDVVDAFVAAGTGRWSGVANIGGGTPVTLNEAIATLERICGPIDVIADDSALGDARATHADISTARRELGYEPRHTLADGLGRMVEWARRQDRVPA